MRENAADFQHPAGYSLPRVVAIGLAAACLFIPRGRPPSAMTTSTKYGQSDYWGIAGELPRQNTGAHASARLARSPRSGRPRLRRATTASALAAVRASLCLCHVCGSRVDCVVVTAGDRRVVGSVQPAADDRRPAARSVNLRPARADSTRSRASAIRSTTGLLVWSVACLSVGLNARARSRVVMIRRLLRSPVHA
jgi:hypothetical protein